MNREKYKSDGGVNLLRFIFSGLASLVTALVMAYILEMAFRSGWYFIFITPIILVLPICTALWFTVVFSHCRNQFLVGSLGALCGLLFFLGQFYVALGCRNWDDGWQRLKFVPSMIWHRLQTSSVESFNPGSKTPTTRGIATHRTIFNGFIFFCEISVMLLACIATPLYRGCRAYSKKLQRWYEEKKFCFDVSMLPLLEKNLSEESLKTVMASQLCAYNPANANSLLITVEYIPPRLQTIAYELTEPEPVYFSVQLGHKKIHRQIVLNPGEINAIASRIPELSSSYEQDHSSSGYKHNDIIIQKLPEGPNAGRVLKPGSIFFAFAMFFAPLMAIFLSVGMICFSLVLILGPEEISVKHMTLLRILGYVAVSFSVLFLISSLYALTKMHSFYAGVYERRLKTEINARPDALIRMGDTGVMLVKYIIHDCSLLPSLEDAKDIGYLKIIDGILLFEGDRERWRIPIEHLNNVKMDEKNIQTGAISSQSIHYLNLQLKTNDFNWEVSVAPLKCDPSKRQELLDPVLGEIMKNKNT